MLVRIGKLLTRIGAFPIGKYLIASANRTPILKTVIKIASRLPLTNRLISFINTADDATLFTLSLSSNALISATIAGSNLACTPNLDKYDNREKLYNHPVTIVIPARNEEDHLPDIIGSLQKQIGVPQLKVLIVDDNSTDNTYLTSITATDDDPRFEVITISTPPPTGWIGKPAALERARIYLEEKNVKIGTLIFVDADVVFEKEEALVRSLLAYRDSASDLFTVWPKHKAVGFLENIFQPLLEWMWMGWAPRIIIDHILPKSPLFGISMGQLLITNWETYQNIGGHYAVRNNTLEDVYFGRSFRKKGYLTGIAFAKNYVSCRMYDSWHELREGYTRWLYMFFNKYAFAIFIPILISLNIIGPSLVFTKRFRLHGLISYFSIAFSQFCGAIATGSAKDIHRWISAAAHPFTTLGALYLTMESHWMAKDTGVVWKNRVITKHGSEDITNTTQKKIDATEQINSEVKNTKPTVTI